MPSVYKDNYDIRHRNYSRIDEIMSLTDFVVLGDKYEEKTSAVNLLKLPENIIESF